MGLKFEESWNLTYTDKPFIEVASHQPFASWYFLGPLTHTLLRQNKIGRQSLFVFCETTDAGADQSARRRQTMAALAGSGLENCFYVGSNCLLHQFHLIVQSLLEETDSFVAAVPLEVPMA